MGLKLQPVSPRQGWTWVRDGTRLFLKRPLAFTTMFLLFLLASSAWLMLPVVGLVALAAMALTLSTAFYVSLWFSFVDNFGSPDDEASAVPPAPALAP